MFNYIIQQSCYFFWNLVCPEGYYGAQCAEICECSKGYTCDPVVGCIEFIDTKPKKLGISRWFF